LHNITKTTTRKNIHIMNFEFKAIPGKPKIIIMFCNTKVENVKAKSYNAPEIN